MVYIFWELMYWNRCNYGSPVLYPSLVLAVSLEHCSLHGFVGRPIFIQQR